MFEIIGPHLLTIAGLALGLLLVASIQRQHNRPAVSIAWLLAILAIPWLAVPAFLLVGGRKLRKQAQRKTELYRPMLRRPEGEPTMEDTIENVLMTAGMPSPRAGQRVEFLGAGEQAYAALMELIGQAKHSIHVMTFILGRDEVGRSLIDLLCRKAREGVQVRLLLDGLGCFLSHRIVAGPLRKAGGKVGVFLPVLPLRRRWSANLRNHRKIVVVDGQSAMIGGMNLAWEYMGPKPDPERWVDSAAIVRGDIAGDLEEIFASDWQFATGETLEQKRPIPPSPLPERHEGVAQVVASGPDVMGDPLYEAILSATYEIRRRVWIVTPYFVPDEGLFRALLLQTRLGRDVRIVLPERSNHLLADLTRGRFLRQLKRMGAKIYLYGPGMIHAKHLVFDDGIAMVGSMNLDMRSLYLNYEVAMFLYSQRELETVSRWMESIMERSHEFSSEEAGYLRMWAEDLSLLVSPLL